MAKTRRRQAKPALCRIRAEHRTGILSDSFAGAREREQAACGFEGLVDEIVYSHEVHHSKPDRRIYEIALERLGVSPDRTVFLDDVQANVDGALALGIEATLFLDTGQAIRDLRTRLQTGRP